MPNTLEIDKDIYNALVESFGEDMLKDKIGDILKEWHSHPYENPSRHIICNKPSIGKIISDIRKVYGSIKA